MNSTLTLELKTIPGGWHVEPWQSFSAIISKSSSTVPGPRTPSGRSAKISCSSSMTSVVTAMFTSSLWLESFWGHSHFQCPLAPHFLQFEEAILSAKVCFLGNIRPKSDLAPFFPPLPRPLLFEGQNPLCRILSLIFARASA